MRYWSDSEVTVYVLDGSEEEIKPDALVDIASNVHYHHLPVSVLDRIGMAGDLVKTEYAELLGDDEFFIPSALEACIAELEADNSLVSCMGRALKFSPEKAGVMGEAAYEEMKGYKVLQNDPVDRMIFHMDPYQPSTVYSVIRTWVWKRAVSILPEKEFLDLGTAELQFELAVSYFGKSKVAPILMWLRSGENPPNRNLEDTPFHKWWIDPNMGADRDTFLAIMASALAVDDSGKLVSIREGVRQACQAYASQYPYDNSGIRAEAWGGGYQQAIVFYSQKLCSATVHRIPRPIKELLKVVLGPFRPAPPKTLLEAARDLEETGVWVDFEELAKIEALISQFHSVQPDQ